MTEIPTNPTEIKTKSKNSKKLELPPFIPELKEFKVKSNVINDDENLIFFFPTPDNLEELITRNRVRGQMEFNKKKYSDLLTFNEEENIIDFTNIKFIQNRTILNTIMFFLGGINGENDIIQFFDYDIENELAPPPVVEDEDLYENATDYVNYIQQNLDCLTNRLPFMDLNNVFKALNEVGINIFMENWNTLYRIIKDRIMSNPENKIMVLLAPSNNFWIKTEKTTINGVNYDMKLNNYNKVFYNTDFVRKFLTKVCCHSRCYTGFLCSMIKRNLEKANSGLQTEFKDLLPDSYCLISQKFHDCDVADKTKFKRNMNLIINFTKGKKLTDFNESNIIIIENKHKKDVENTKANSIFAGLFTEDSLSATSEEQKKATKEKEDKLINYLLDLLENCVGSVTDYIADHPLNF